VKQATATRVEALATDQFGNTDIEEITVKLKD
jgi:hypothetical protein